MDKLERAKVLAYFGFNSYASYLREMTERLEVGEAGGINTFGASLAQARASLKAMSRSQGRKYRTFRKAENQLTVIRTK